MSRLGDHLPKIQGSSSVSRSCSLSRSLRLRLRLHRDGQLHHGSHPEGTAAADPAAPHGSRVPVTVPLPVPHANRRSRRAERARGSWRFEAAPGFRLRWASPKNRRIVPEVPRFFRHRPKGAPGRDPAGDAGGDGNSVPDCPARPDRDPDSNAHPNSNSHSGSGSGSGSDFSPLAGERVTVSGAGAAWLASKRTWAILLVMRFSLDVQDVEDVVQEGLAIAAIHWGSFVLPAGLPEALGRRRWLARILFNTAARYRHRAARRRRREVELGDEVAQGVAGASPREVVSAAELLRKLEGATTAARWRVWTAYEIDGVAVEEIARLEGCPVSSIYHRIQDARDDLARAVVRERAAGEGPMVRRHREGRSR